LIKKLLISAIKLKNNKLNFVGFLIVI
jgi:hypothetical protein